MASPISETGTDILVSSGSVFLYHQMTVGHGDIKMADLDRFPMFGNFAL
jgi:hypothetical protein